MPLKTQIDSAVALLQSLIETQSFSSEEDGTALLIINWLEEKGITLSRKRNNIYAFNKHYDASKPLLLLNSHHDTVKPNKGYTRDPYNAEIKDGKLWSYYS